MASAHLHMAQGPRTGRKTNWQGVAEGLLNQYVKDKDTRDCLVGIHTQPKPGIRKIRFTSNVADVSDAA